MRTSLTRTDMKSPILLSLICVLAMQFTDLNFFGGIKLGDVLSFILISILFGTIARRSFIPKLYIRFLFIFSALLVISLLCFFWVDFYPPKAVADSFFKRPGFISVSRYIQYILCILFAVTIHVYISMADAKKRKLFVLFVDKLMLLFCVSFLLFWVAAIFGLDSPFVYGSDNRLRGGFVEGGPYGLMVASYLLFRFFLLGKYGIKIWLIVCGATLIASESKAGMLALLVGFIAIQMINKPLRRNFRGIMAILIIAIISIEYTAAFEKISGYWNDYINIFSAIQGREEDPALVMGRVAALHIAPKIFADNWLFGVGFGNYSLVRNNPNYRGVIPPTDEWDLTGLGGLATFALESGLFGFVLFLLSLIPLWNGRRAQKEVLLIFLLPQIFGVQLYFHYIWYFLAVGYGFRNHAEDQKLISHQAHQYGMSS